MRYNVTVFTKVVSYRLLYLSRGQIFRADCSMDKTTLDIYINSFVRLPSYLIPHLKDGSDSQLFFLEAPERLIRFNDSGRKVEEPSS
jgi:hypothetical protein